MRFKYYLRGIGIGIIFSSIVLIVSFQIHGGLMTDQRVVERAQELGMIFPEAETESQQEQVDVSETDNTEDSAPAEEIQTEDTEMISTETNKPYENSEVEEAEYVNIHISKGEYCRAIATKLLAEGLIEDSDSFMKYMNKHDYDNLIQPGDFEIPRGADFKEIAIILTTKK